MSSEKQATAAPLEVESRAKRIFDDLLNLEINVISTPGMTARKMPDPRSALANIAQDYEGVLAEFSAQVKPVWEEERQKNPEVRVMSKEDAIARGEKRSVHSLVNDEGLLSEMHTGSMVTLPDDKVGFDTFDRLREWALETAAVYWAVSRVDDWPDRESLAARGVLFKRIYRNCDQLKRMLDGLDHEDRDTRTVVKRDMGLTSDQLITLRKIWDVGVATVVMQTVVQLDGDIVTRIHENHAATSNASLQNLHREAVDNALKNWQFLGQTLAHFLTSALKAFL